MAIVGLILGVVGAVFQGKGASGPYARRAGRRGALLATVLPYRRSTYPCACISQHPTVARDSSAFRIRWLGVFGNSSMRST